MSRVRAAEFRDFNAMDNVQRRNGLGPLNALFWGQVCHRHPYQHLYPNSPPGWVIENDDAEIVGSVINVLLPAECEGRTFRAVASSAWGVVPEYRDLLALKMLLEWFRQPDADIWLVGSANETATQVMHRFQSTRIPMPDYLDAMFWILNARAFATCALRKKNVPAASILGWPAGAALSIHRGLYHHTRKRMGNTRVSRLDTFDERFDAFWDKLRAQGSRIRVLRDRAMLDWRFAVAAHEKTLTILVAENGSHMVGYAVLMSLTRPQVGLRQNSIMDLQALGDDENVLHSLLDSAIRASQDQGMDALEWLGFTPVKRKIALERHPYHYGYQTWPLYCKARDKAVHQQLTRPEVWDFCLYDTF